MDKYIAAGWLSDTTAGGATTFFNGVDLVSHKFKITWCSRHLGIRKSAVVSLF